MKIYVVDSFANKPFCGNQAGVALLTEQEMHISDEQMRLIAAELKHSETAFVTKIDETTFKFRYFTPVEEVELCGHATIATFAAMRDLNLITTGTYIAMTKAGKLTIDVAKDCIWMDMATPEEGETIPKECYKELYEALHITMEDKPEDLDPAIISTGLSDILLPVKNADVLNRMELNSDAVIKVSKKWNVIGIHAFCEALEDDVTAHCRNFAPICGIPEEAATGTSNGALCYYLYQHKCLTDKDTAMLIQGEAMGKPSPLYGKACMVNGQVKIQIGGNAVIMMACEPVGFTVR